ncbi:MAG: AMP-binding protein [Flavobacteriales bacterium]
MCPTLKGEYSDRKTDPQHHRARPRRGIATRTIGRKGELYTGGMGVALGYWRRDELTAERFIDDPFLPTPGASSTTLGDIVRWTADGTIKVHQRADGQVKVRGFHAWNWARSRTL